MQSTLFTATYAVRACGEVSCEEAHRPEADGQKGLIHG